MKPEEEISVERILELLDQATDINIFMPGEAPQGAAMWNSAPDEPEGEEAYVVFTDTTEDIITLRELRGATVKDDSVVLEGGTRLVFLSMSKPQSSSQEQDLWKEDPQYPRSDWAYEVANDDTLLGYWDWVRNKKESL